MGCRYGFPANGRLKVNDPAQLERVRSSVHVDIVWPHPDVPAESLAFSADRGVFAGHPYGIIGFLGRPYLLRVRVRQSGSLDLVGTSCQFGVFSLGSKRDAPLGRSNGAPGSRGMNGNQLWKKADL